VAQKPVLDVLGLQRLAQEGVVLQVDHPDRQVVAGAPVGIDLPKLFTRKRVCSGRKLIGGVHIGLLLMSF
jgi:hypothetical protein